MKHFKNKNNEIYAYTDEQVANGYGKDMTALENGEFTNGEKIFKYKLDSTYKKVTRNKDGNVTSPKSLVDSLAQKNIEKIKKDTDDAIQNLLDITAQSFQWDDMKSARAGADIIKDTDLDEIKAMKQNANDLKDWYYLVWAKAIQIENDVKDGNRAIPTTKEVLAEMPKYGE